MTVRLPSKKDVIARAIKSGPQPKMRNWRKLSFDKLTRAERTMAFAEHYLKVPEGLKIGERLELEPFQEAFLYSVLDNPAKTRMAILSVARRNGKSFLTSVVLLSALVGPLAEQNAVLCSAAQSRDQAALIFRMMVLMINASPELQSLTRIVPSSKTIHGLALNTTFHSLSSEAKSNLGRSISVIVHDEAGAIRGPTNDYTEMLKTSQGSVRDPIYITISTQAPSDADYLSVLIDDAERSNDPRIVAHVYAADKDADVENVVEAAYANPGLGIFRGRDDLESQLTLAARLPSQESRTRNLLLNQRISLESVWLAPGVWKSCGDPINENVFRESFVTLGLDLSLRTDLTAAVIAAQDADGVVHLKPYVFTPLQGLSDRAARDRAPYDAWVRDGYLIAVPGATVDYEWVCDYLKGAMDDIGVELSAIEFDRWRIREMKDAAERVGFASYAQWNEVGQGYQSMSPRIEKFEELLLQGKIRHGLHPLLNMAAANAIIAPDKAGNRKLDKSASTLRIDPIVAAVMAASAAATADEATAFIV